MRECVTDCRSVRRTWSPHAPTAARPSGRRRSRGAARPDGLRRTVRRPGAHSRRRWFAHTAERLLVEALSDLGRTRGRIERTCVAVPAHWPCDSSTGLRALLPDAMVTSDAVAALTALRTQPGLPTRGVAPLRFRRDRYHDHPRRRGGRLRTVGDVRRQDDFSGDLIDRAVLTHLLAGLDVDPATSAVARSPSFGTARIEGSCRSGPQPAAGPRSGHAPAHPLRARNVGAEALGWCPRRVRRRAAAQRRAALRPRRHRNGRRRGANTPCHATPFRSTADACDHHRARPDRRRHRCGPPGWA